MTALRPHLSSIELESEYEAAAEPVAKSHFHALWLVPEGCAVAEVARLLAFSARWVHTLIKRCNEKGPAALAGLRSGNGARPRLLTPEALQALKERIVPPPDDGGVWSGPKIARWLANFRKLKPVHDQRGWDALVAIGYSIQKPRPRHPQAASEEQRQHPHAAVELWAMDEHRIGLKPIVRGVRAPVGERPIATGHQRFEWLYVAGFAEPLTGKTVWNIAEAISKKMFGAHARRLRQVSRRGAGQAHRPAARQRPLAPAGKPRRARRPQIGLPARLQP